MTGSAQAQAPTDTSPRTLTRLILLIMAVAAGLSVAGNYFAQPLLGLLQSELHMTTTNATLTVAVAQIGYALGLFFLVPLGDRYSRRGLSAVLLIATGLLLALAGSATNGSVLLAATGLVAVTSVGAQILVPFVAELSTPDSRARNIGIVMAGVLAGGIGGRAFAGIVAEAAGWRAVYWSTAVMLVIVAFVVFRLLPPKDDAQQGNDTSLTSLMRSTVTLLVELPALRRPILAAMLSMASYIIHLTTITLLLDDEPYSWNPAFIGLIGLIGFIGPLSMPMAGRFVDQGHAKTVLVTGLLLSTTAWVVMLPAQSGQIAWLIAGIILINVGHTAMLNAAQSTCYELRPTARSRINAVFMTLFFAGGAAGGAAVSVIWAHSQWVGTCVLGAILAGLGLLVAASFRSARSNE
ncbi:MFS transporter [Glycomyces buryatensis]|uniref:MFS transporter n=1 Tax=Glycomyces buryatensis TaxID=2570927 RepID=A0A4S8QCX4_9ACTN|nr:MFS transporter [Glycomyces buryatensis]THV42218.1 MFS transporter [Glycomyces buryatensis]